MSSPFATPSEAPEQSGWKFTVEENIGALFAIEPTGTKDVETTWGDKEVIVADITEIDVDNPKDSETHEDVFIFAAWIQGQVRHEIAGGGIVLGVLEQDADKGQGKNAAWILEDANEEEVEAATEWLNSRSRSKLKGSKDDEGDKRSRRRR